MENASKALIIAGAILLAIVIISLGLIVVNNTRNTVDTANLNEQETQAFNAKFTPYESTKVTGARVKSLIQTVIASNQENKDDSDRKVTIAAPGMTDSTNGSNDISEIAKATIELKSNYKVELGYNTKSLVSKITITKNL